MRQQGATGGVVMLEGRPRYRGDDRRRLAPDSEAWRTAATGLLTGIVIAAAMLRRPADLASAAEQENMLLAVTAAFALAASAVLLSQHSISGRSHELLSGWGLAAFAVGHLALVERGPGEGALLSDRAAAAYAVSQGLALVCFALRLRVPSIEPRARGVVVAASILALPTGLAVASVDAWRTKLDELARPQPEGAILLDLCLGGLWLVTAVCAARRRTRPSHAWSDPLTIVLVGCSLAALAPVLADLTHGDPGRSHLVLTFGTSLCALVMGADALVRLVRGQHARLLASEVDRVFADQALAAERAARSELDHDLTGALMAVEGAARALERRDPRADSNAQHALAKAIASELARLQQLLGGVRDEARGGVFGIAAAILPVITCDLAQGVDIRTEVPRGLMARGSPLATAQVVRNLLDNAQRHAPGASVHISAAREGPWVCIRVEDGGPGVGDPDRARIFQRGARGSEAPPDGSGLGLFVAARMMAEQGGDLVLEDSRPSSFCLRLRAVEGPDDA